jgi:tetratricopeptide (TPR) repeat protein
MYANLMLVNNKTEDAIRIYSQLLDKEPDNFNTLSQLIELLRRAGRIKQVATFLESAEASCQRSNLAGLHFCKGLYAWHTGDPIQGLKDLNVARFDNIYGQ